MISNDALDVDTTSFQTLGMHFASTFRTTLWNARFVMQECDKIGILVACSTSVETWYHHVMGTKVVPFFSKEC